jgi:hypothetical protein
VRVAVHVPDVRDVLARSKETLFIDAYPFVRIGHYRTT